jgi:hypothetical protein
MMNSAPTLHELEQVFRNDNIWMPPTIRKIVIRYIHATRSRSALKAARTRRRRARAA